MDKKTEIRKLSIKTAFNLMQYLDNSLFWKELMSKIPKNLDSNDTALKYNSDHIIIIENAASKENRLCSEILFQEWGTSGRRRPTIEDLLQILIKLGMYRAADIVSIEMLKGTAVKRPTHGPAAPVDTDVTNILRDNKKNNTEIEDVLNNMPYPSTNILQSKQPFNNNINKASALNTPKVVYKYPIIPYVSDSTINPNQDFSNLIQFSNDLPNMEAINENAIIPSISTLLDGEDLNESCSVAPAINDSDYVDSSLDQNDSSQNTDLDKVNKDGEEISVPNSSTEDELIPMLSAFQRTSMIDMRITENIPHTPLILSTNLPHIKYNDIKMSTCNFSDCSDPLNLRGGKIGSGGFGVVYLAFDLVSKPVAVKRLQFQKNSKEYNNQIVKQFKAEVEVLSKYCHANIVSLLGYSCDGPSNCLIYEYVNGGSLREALDKGGLPWLERLQIALETCFGIEYLHTGYSTPLIHRDIKSANIMLTVSGTPKLCDFGIAKFLKPQNDTTTIIGTSAYMAPETLIGDVSVKMDIFSFGVVLLELLTGLPPTVKDREGEGSFTLLIDVCADHDVEQLLDKTAGSCNHPEKLYTLAKLCLDKKKNRPEIVMVRYRLQEICVLLKS